MEKNKNMKNILITGGAGFIGSNLTLKLIKQGYSITILDILSPQIHGENPINDSPLFKSIYGKVKFIKGSITSKKDIKEAIIDQDAIIHLAAETGTGQSMYKIKNYNKTNILGTAILLDVLANSKHNISKIVVASSRSIYGEGKYFSQKYGIVYPSSRAESDMLNGDFNVKYLDDENLELLPTDENSLTHPTSVYGITKLTQEQLIMNTCPAIGIKSVSLRYQNVYGPGQSLSNPYTGILSIFSTQINNNNNINVFEDGLESRDFVYIDDVVDATILSLENNQSNNKYFNVGYGEPTTVINVAETLKKIYESEINIEVTGNFRLGDIRHNYADLSEINKYLDFKPKYNFESGIRLFCEWVKTQEVYEDKLVDSLNEMKRKGLFK